ncbi:MAG: DNA polymerase IV [Gemmatimonadales bacterium]
MHSGTPPARILQVDADAFYVQVARLIDPEGAGTAELLLVGGTPQGRGVVTSASYATRRLGARSGMPMAQALRLCPGAMVVGVPRRACADRSRAIVAVLERFTPVVEPASIDEMYLDLSGTEALYGHEPLETTARRIRQAVLDETEIAVSIGGATTRLVAKLAANRAKPHRTGQADGVIIVRPGDEATFLRQFVLAEIPGVGPRFQERLERLGLKTVPDALRHERRVLERWLGARAGGWLYQRIRGTDPTPVVQRERAKSISRDETFAEDIDDDETLRRELLRLADRAAGDLRHHGYTTRTVSVRIRDADFRDRHASKTLHRPVSSDRAIYHVARALFARLRKARSVPARLLGVSLSHLGGAMTEEQLGLFAEDSADELETARDRRLSEAIDQARRKFGRGALGRGGV